MPSPSGKAPNTGIRKLYSWKLILSLAIVPGTHAGAVWALAVGDATTTAAVAARPRERCECSFHYPSLVMPGPVNETELRLPQPMNGMTGPSASCLNTRYRRLEPS